MATKKSNLPGDSARDAAAAIAAKMADTLSKRSTHGAFDEHAIVAQELRDWTRSKPGWAKLSPPMRQAMDTIGDKWARILTGDPTFADHWHDQAGYALLVEGWLASRKAPNA